MLHFFKFPVFKWVNVFNGVHFLSNNRDKMKVLIALTLFAVAYARELEKSADQMLPTTGVGVGR